MGARPLSQERDAESGYAMNTAPLSLITRVDDAGLCESVNDAVLDVASSGLVRNVSIMAPVPALAQLAERLRGRSDLCLGLHVTLNAEWERVRWRPLSPLSEVASLVDSEGYFLPHPRDMHDRCSDPAEMMREIRRQLDALRKAGLDIRYLDEHMGVSWACGLREHLAEFARSEGLVDAHALPSLPSGNVPHNRKHPAEAWSQRVLAADAGTYVLVSHVGFDRPDLQRLQAVGQPEGVCAAERDAERRAWHDPSFRQAIESRQMRLLRYDQVLPET